jgi:hypothetical protein
MTGNKPDSCNAEQRRLLAIMRDMSETRWCAGWLGNLEFILWEFMNEIPGDALGEFGSDNPFDKHDRARLREAYEAAGGWWIYWGKGNVFLSSASWENYYSNHISAENHNGSWW